MTGRAQVIEFAGFWALARCLLGNSILKIPSNREPRFFSLELMQRGILRCDHASGGRPRSRICSAHGKRWRLTDHRWRVGGHGGGETKPKGGAGKPGGGGPDGGGEAAARQPR